MREAAIHTLSGLNQEVVAGLARALGHDNPAELQAIPWWDALLREIRSSADPEPALNRIEAIAAAGDIAGIVEGNSIARQALVATVAASGSIASHLRAHPQDVVLLAEVTRLPAVDPGAALSAAREAIRDQGDPVEALRLHKRRAYLKLTAADLMGYLSVEQVGAALASLASACLEAAVDVAASELDASIPMAVIGMGKLGANELNYASDIDVMFVSAEDDDIARRHAERVITIIGGATPVESIFKIDVDLRPEGRAGPLVRTLDSFRAYWEKWAHTWEFQALIKSRPVAGDKDLGREFEDAAQRFVWPETLDPEAIRAIRAMKARSEQELVKRGAPDREVKRGPGGIRDIEFAVQLLQLVHGRADMSLRDRSTLGALQALASGGYVDTADAAALADAYRFLRTVEHRLQIRDERQVYSLPSDPAGMEILAKTLGIRGRGNISATDIFEKVYRDNNTVVRSIHERLFFRPLLEAFAAAPAGAGLSEAAAAERLAAFGFSDMRRARAGLAELTRGLSRSSRLMHQLLPLILEWLSESPDPDLGLTGLRNLIDAVGDKANLVTTFRENPTAAQQLCTVLGTSRVLSDLMAREPEVLGTFTNEAKSPAAISKEALSFTAWRSGHSEQFEAINRFHRREFLRIGTRDIVFGVPVREIGAELAALGDSVLQVALDSALAAIPGPDMEFAVIAMGSYGGAEMNYSSDLDVIFVHDGGDTDRALAVAAQLFENFQGIASRGVAFTLDAALRPEGKSGPIVRSLESTLQYYDKWAETWEFQALTKARHGAGIPSLTARLLDEVQPLVWPSPFPAERVREIRIMKARMERERIPAGEDPEFHLKLGPGGLSDVEFAVQLAALRHAGDNPDLRKANTLDALDALEEADIFDSESAGRLRDGYEFCTRVRNRLFLIKGRQLDALPQDPRESARLGESLGWSETPRATLRTEYKRHARRARAAFEDVFYSDNSGNSG